MSRVAFTIWFTFAAITGPWICCCTFAAVKSTQASTKSTQDSTKSHAISPAKPSKSCCEQDTPAGNDRQTPTPTEPGKPCCCEQIQIDSIPPDADVNDALTAQLKLLNGQFASFFVLQSCDDLKLIAFSANISQPVYPLAGRALLATYCTLNC